MVIKWKTLSRKTITKAAVFILLILSFAIGVLSALDIYLNVENYESITVKDYMESNTLSNEMRYAANRLEYILRVYKSEEFIRSGKTVEHLGIKDNWQLTNLYNNFIAEKGLQDNQESEELFWVEKSDEIAEAKEIIKKSDLSNYEQIIYDLNNPEGLIYYAADGSNVCTNTDNSRKSFYNIRDAYILGDEQGIIIKPENGANSYSPSLLDRFEEARDGEGEITIYVGITDSGLANRIEKWNTDRNILIKNIIVIVFCILFILASFIFLAAVAGRKPGEDKIYTIFLDKLYTDLNIIFIIGIISSAIAGFNKILNIRYTNINLMEVAAVFASIAIASAFMTLFLSLVRHIKKGTLIKYSIIVIVLSKVLNLMADIINSGPLMLKTMLSIIIFMSTTIYAIIYPPLLLIILAIALSAAYQKVKAFKLIQEGLKLTKEGDYEFKISLKGNGEFKRLADDINTITDGLKIAVQNEVKSERLKTELITNVSHDIKTPLTSIISYVDLLKRDGLHSQNAPKYLDILERKSNRLKVLTEDLFEAARVTSGSVSVNFEKVNVNDLVSQILGELDEKIQECRLNFIVNTAKEKIYANADGRLLSRVMENLLSNIFKYALKGSRVYIDITSTERDVSICFKNVSAYELNIPADELMLRFKRGDESRNSEGNGLGLAIARSLMEVQKGALEISIDGDLFKAEIVLEKYD